MASISSTRQGAEEQRLALSKGEGGRGAEETCSVCKGLGYLRADVPLGHPDFGKLVPCTCRLAELARRRVAALRTLSDLETLARMTFGTFAPEGHGLPPDKRANLRWAYEEAQGFAEKPEGWLVLKGGYGCGKCVAAGTYIPTERGLVLIETLSPAGQGEHPSLNITVETPAGPKMTSHFYRGGYQRTVCIRTRAGFELEGTLEHPLWVMNRDGNPGWKPMGELRIGDYVAIHRYHKHGTLFGNQDALPSFQPQPRSPFCRTVEPAFPEALDEEVGYILGLLVGDGSLTLKGGRVGLSTADEEILTAYEHWAQRLGLRIIKLSGQYDWAIDNVYHKEWLNWLGLKPIKSSDKEVPFRILQASRHVIRAFLQGLFDADGSGGAFSVELGSASEQLLHQVQLLLLQFGLVAARRQRPSGHWRLNITGDQARRFYSEIGFRLARKQEGLTRMSPAGGTDRDVIPHIMVGARRPIPRQVRNRFTNYFKGTAWPSYETLSKIPVEIPARSGILETRFYWDQITSLSPGTAEVFDITVPEGHTFVANGFVSHNTHLAAAIANHCVERGQAVLFITVPDLLDHLRAAFAPSSPADYDTRFEEVRTAPVLILDDLGTESGTTWAQEKLFQIFNYRYNARLPTVITTNRELEEIPLRLRSRLVDPDLARIVSITAPDYRRAGVPHDQSDLSSLSLHSHQTFETFDLRKGELPPEEEENLKRAFDIARGFAKNPGDWLVFTGTYGSGKTHLVAAIANYRAAQGHPALFVVVPDLLDHLRATFNPQSTVSFDQRFEEVRRAPLLILDDLGTESATPWAREKLYQIFDYRYNARLPTVITTATPIEELDPRLATRMLDVSRCVPFAILAPAYRGGPPRRKAARRRR